MQRAFRAQPEPGTSSRCTSNENWSRLTSAPSREPDQIGGSIAWRDSLSKVW